MNKFRLTSVFILFCLVSCKKTPPSTNNEYRVWLNPDVKLEDVFTVKIRLKVLHNDEFKVYYTQDNTENFNEENTVRTKINGSNEVQLLTFKFPKGTKPTNLRIDFGFNKEQRVFELNNLELSCHDNYFTIPGPTFLDYFKIFDNRLIFDASTAQLYVNKDIDRKQYLPITVSKESLNAELKYFYQENAEPSYETVEFDQEQLLYITEKNNARFRIEKFEFDDNYRLKVKGWAMLENVNSTDTKLKAILLKDNLGYIIESENKSRPDVTNFFKLNYNADNSGFEIDTRIRLIPKGNYVLGVLLNNDKKGIEGLSISNKQLTIL
ncbi:hypothetical protein [Tamlana flava]|uniref:hypothetical protein n=1 Tax=Tamlana flava TaxID=3158572 RepID=UPI00351B7BF9